LSTDGVVSNHEVIWNLGNLSINGTDSFKLLHLTIKAPDNILKCKDEQLNLTAIYSDPCNRSYDPTTLTIPVHLISPTYIDLKVANLSVPDNVIVGIPVNIAGIIQNIGDIGLTHVPVRLFIDKNETALQIIEAISSGDNVILNYVEQFNITGVHTVEIAIQSVGLESNTTNNYLNKTITVLPTSVIFDTGPSKNPYPSIMGTHKGEIKPSCNITVSKLYIYPCPGTGGHTESIELYENGTLIANGTWEAMQATGITLHYITYQVLLTSDC